ncbi:MAG: hypothetical protein KDB69_07935 [Acidimicrobiia bacterium]|nr:hypothetical protein [Acidimicrobiia bacterium]
MAVQIPRWTGRAVIVAMLGVVTVWVLLGWLHANALRAEFMVPLESSGPFDLTVVANEAGRVTVDRTDATVREGIWGLEGTEAYGRLGPIVRVTDETVERGITPQVGDLVPGTPARIDVDAYTGDPLTALGIGFEPLRSPSEIGPQPAWFIDGRRGTWVIFVHGRGTDRLTESLRITPSLVEQGFPVMAITIRNDDGATPSESGLRYWGIEEWHDVDAAIEAGLRKGAQDFVLIGSGFGSEIVSMFLHESQHVDLVKGVVFDSPVLDLEDVAVRYAEAHGTPGIVAWLGRRLTALRFGLDWSLLDQVARSAEFDVPILLLHGAQDPVTPVETFEAFADARPDIVRRHRFEQATHTDLWNVDSARYERTVADFMLEIAGPE